MVSPSSGVVEVAEVYEWTGRVSIGRAPSVGAALLHGGGTTTACSAILSR